MGRQRGVLTYGNGCSILSDEVTNLFSEVARIFNLLNIQGFDTFGDNELIGTRTTSSVEESNQRIHIIIPCINAAGLMKCYDANHANNYINIPVFCQSGI